ncbi:hypothetical protein M885DRAFT_553031 [Pelagophyceae sp. CCMP2097]|nr:hypothetical protein M885DRAFT_553031 [Pelagophyceae sp. CCMP2097]|mmetsp:Transcript_20106/g.71477  ORF Transcript_20106/g.71477 Transcript_20106/m.71477 type:complete len:308 (+) Transcript_20106:190-1113(+)
MAGLFIDTRFDSSADASRRVKQSPKVGLWSTDELSSALESGEAHEFIAEDLLTPRDGAWTQCTLTRPQKNRFELRDAQGMFLLAATVSGNDALVETFNDDEEDEEARPSFKSTAGAIVKRSLASGHVGLSYKMHLLVDGDALTAPILEVFPAQSRIGDNALELQILRVFVTRQGSPRAHYRRDPSKRRASTPNGTKFSEARQPGDALKIEMQSKLPNWSAGVLTQKFRPGRVRASSSKNYLVYTLGNIHDPRHGDDVESASFQLGKLAAKTFALDFKSPLSALQAFGLALAAFDAKHARPPPSRWKR